MYRKKGMERIQDSLLQDLERATSNLKNNPNQLGGWKLNKPGDSTISSGYSTARVAKHYSPQYYVNDEPLYQNDSIGRSYSHADSYTTEHDYAAINGRSSTASTVPKTPTSPLHEGSTRHLSPKPFSYTAGKVPTDNEEEDAISEKISMIDSLLDDLNSARRSYERSTATLPSKSHQPRNHSPRNASTASLDRQQHTNRVTFADSHTQVPNGMANGDSHPVKRVNFRDRADSDQVNLLIRDLEHNLHNTSSPSLSRNTNGIAANKSVPNMNGMQPKQSTPSPMQSAQVQPVSEYNRQLVNIHPQQVKMENNPVIQVPLTGCNTSNATRELDDLMASLSDFKLNQMKNQANKSNYVPIGRVQVPSNTQAKPVYSINELDSMIGNLEVDFNKHGVNITKGNCEACGRAIVGQVVAALGKTWHPEHFTCVQCQQELGDKNFFEREGLAYCEEDYHKLFSPKCNYCNKPIYDRCITALDKTWHPEHFFCAHCGKNFGDEGYHEKAGNAYCKEDFFKLFAPKCSGCANPIVDNYVTALGGQWHSDCFVCRDCKSPFTEGKTFFDFEGNPYCETHYHNKRGTLCASCHKPITGRCITAMFQKYHPEHFICSFCLKQLNKGTFKKHNEKPYCHSCFDKLFA